MTLMFDSYSRELLRSGIIEGRAGNKDVARRYLDRAIYMSSDHDAMAEAWFWMSQVTDDPVGKRKALENCLSNDLQHARARRALAILDGNLKADEIVNPDKLPPAPEGLHQAEAQRFMCPKCGGRMTFAPDGQSLVCEYCARHQSLNAPSASAEEKDFIVAMATARGHDKPLAGQVVHCQGCGAEFILPPDQLSVNCVYCGSPHVVSLEKSNDLLAPDGILPLVVDRDRAVRLLVDWVGQNGIKPEKKVERPRGLYLPLWTFDLGGNIDYTGERLENQEGVMRPQPPQGVRVSDSYPVLIDDLPIPASRKLSAPFVRLLPTFDLKPIKPYDPRYLADWPAELYDVPMADASLDARQQAFARLTRYLPSRLHPLQLTFASSARMTIESFRLNLLPVWMTEVWAGGRSHLVLMDGQNGAIESDLTIKADKSGGLMEWLADLIKE